MTSLDPCVVANLHMMPKWSESFYDSGRLYQARICRMRGLEERREVKIERLP